MKHLLFALCAVLYAARSVSAFPIKVREGDTMGSIKIEYNLKPGALEAANSSINFKKFLITGMPLEIPKVDKAELDAALERNNELVGALDTRQKEFNILNTQHETLKNDYQSVSAQRDKLQPVADSAGGYKVWVRLLVLGILVLGFMVMRLTHKRAMLIDNISTLREERKSFVEQLQQQKQVHAQQMLELQKTLTGRTPLRAVPKGPKT